MNEIETKDIFRGAYLLCMGGTLHETKLADSRQVTFVIEGKNLEQKDIQYHTGHALVNPIQLRETLNLLRDLIFEMRNAARRRQDDKKNIRHRTGANQRQP